MILRYSAWSLKRVSIRSEFVVCSEKFRFHVALLCPSTTSVKLNAYEILVFISNDTSQLKKQWSAPFFAAHSKTRGMCAVGDPSSFQDDLNIVVENPSGCCPECLLGPWILLMICAVDGYHAGMAALRIPHNV